MDGAAANQWPQTAFWKSAHTATGRVTPEADKYSRPELRPLSPAKSGYRKVPMRRIYGLRCGVAPETRIGSY